MGDNIIKFWIGENSSPVSNDRSEDSIMDSVINYIGEKMPEYSRPKSWFLDNGAFTARTKGLTLDPIKILDKQEQFSPEFAIPLDVPLDPSMTLKQMLDGWEQTQENILIWTHNSKLKNHIVPALHAWSFKSIAENVNWIVKSSDSEYISLGSLVGNEFANSGFFGDRAPTYQFIDSLAKTVSTVRDNSDLKIHFLGGGSSPIILSILSYLGIESTDSAGARRKAAYGKVVFPMQGELYSGNGKANFGRDSNKRRNSSKIEQYVSNCGCKICRSEGEKGLYSDWKNRAIHNEYVMTRQEKILNEIYALDGIEGIERYITASVQKSSLNRLWKHLIKMKKEMGVFNDI